MLHMKLSGIVGLLLIFSSCIKNNPNPAWIEVAVWNLEANPLLSGEEGELNHNFTDAYITVGGKIMGIFELPCKIPVLMDGSQYIEIYPVIRKNGISATKGIYPFCQPFTMTADLVKNETLQISPKTRYFTSSEFAFIEDFESASLKFETDGISNASLQQVLHTDPGKSGNCGHISLNATDSLWLGYTHDQMVLPKGGREVYLEIEYKMTNTLLTGVLAISPGSVKNHDNIQLNAQEASVATWRKAYIELKEIVSFSLETEYFEQYLKAVLDPGKSSADIYIDNIKVIHF